MNIEIDSDYMDQAIVLAKRGLGQTSPNPLVGAILVKDGVVIGGGYHKKAGSPHAEPNAILDAENRGYDVDGATLYCTLEPCCHTDKKTPPCTDLIIRKKISRVVVGSIDPNPIVAGRGIAQLKDAGVEVLSGVLKEQCDNLNYPFKKNITKKSAYIHLKAAITIDGKIASKTGDSKWITNEESRHLVHWMRCKYDAVLIGHKTLVTDNPSLTIRHGVFCNNKMPWKIVLGDYHKLDLSAPFFHNDIEKILIAHTGEKVVNPKFKILNFDNWKQFSTELYRNGIYSVLVEGGSSVLSSLLESDEYDEISLFQAPKLIGNGLSLFNSEHRSTMCDALCFDDFSFELIEGEYSCIHWQWRRS
jgi:diaminohydroxyphosphoribosylaminopyrimidine deaminase/5-amino-6-(5-phosphoribosylamino)uracil reductase